MIFGLRHVYFIYCYNNEIMERNNTITCVDIRRDEWLELSFTEKFCDSLVELVYRGFSVSTDNVSETQEE